ncbi:hypothetical protein TUBRATIS_002790 [Tubulinosema ratisbonensis]|uniref:Uncharacterized protein n=1 Tax=Tubulinosema ratisbonensis TaxID=291195 RepID=A0A437AQD1_9MICR|nr:hypothetical protein TUBRATIS_002790 [Tubulinosema ratisbonensis]
MKVIDLIIFYFLRVVYSSEKTPLLDKKEHSSYGSNLKTKNIKIKEKSDNAKKKFDLEKLESIFEPREKKTVLKN